MCYERWARRRDEAVESRWLRDLQSRGRQDEPRPLSVEDDPTEEPVVDPAIETLTGATVE